MIYISTINGVLKRSSVIHYILKISSPAQSLTFSHPLYPGTLFINHRAEFDPERPSVSIVIEASDGGSPSLSSLTTVQVQISDVNDNAPVFHQSEYRSVYSLLHSGCVMM